MVFFEMTTEAILYSVCPRTEPTIKGEIPFTAIFLLFLQVFIPLLLLFLTFFLLFVITMVIIRLTHLLTNVISV